MLALPQGLISLSLLGYFLPLWRSMMVATDVLFLMHVLAPTPAVGKISLPSGTCIFRKAKTTD